MTVLSNVEFEKLVSEQSPVLKTIARKRCDASPVGHVMLAELAEITQTFDYTGDRKTAQWLKNLAVLAKNGKIAKLRSGNGGWQEHAEHVAALHRAAEIPFGLGQHIFVSDEGRYGSVVDYIPDTKEYLVVLDPFQVKQYKKDELKKVASITE